MCRQSSILYNERQGVDHSQKTCCSFPVLESGIIENHCLKGLKKIKYFHGSDSNMGQPTTDGLQMNNLG